MRRRTWDSRGMVVHQGRCHHRPFGVVGTWPERQQGLDAMQAAESATNEARAAYRAWERRQRCGDCGAPPGMAHQQGCATPWG